MALETLPDSLLDFVVELAGWNHGWRLEVASPALRAASAACVARRLGTCRWTGERGTAVFLPRWRHCAVAKRCGPYLLHPGDRSVSDIIGETGNGSGDDRYVTFKDSGKHAAHTWQLAGGNERYVTINDYAHTNFFEAVFLTRSEAERFMVKRVPGSTDGRILSLQRRMSPTSAYRGEEVLSIYSQTRGGIGSLCLISFEYDLPENMTLDGRATRSQHFRTQWLLHCGCHTSHLPFRRAMNALHFPDEPRRGNRVMFDVGPSRFRSEVPHWELLPAALPEDEMFFEFEHPQL